VAFELVRSGHLIRSMRLLPFMVGAVAVAALFVHRGGFTDVTGPLRALGLVLALAGGFVLDDTAATTLQASPYPLARRLVLRMGFAEAVIAVLWCIALWRVLPTSADGQRAALALGLTVELAAASTLVWATAAWGRRRGLDEPGIATAPLLLALIFVGVAQQRVPLVVGPGANWLTAHMHWTAILTAATACLAYAMRDPAARTRRAIARTIRAKAGRRCRR
jgi:hypothetical protein